MTETKSIQEFLVSRICKVIEHKRESSLDEFNFDLSHDSESNTCHLHFHKWTPDPRGLKLPGTYDSAKFTDIFSCTFSDLQSALDTLAKGIKGDWKLYYVSFQFPHQGGDPVSSWPNENKTYRKGSFYVSTDVYVKRKRLALVKSRVASLEEQLKFARKELEDEEMNV